MLRGFLRGRLWKREAYRRRPSAADVVRCHLAARQFPEWTSFFLEYRAIQDTHFGKSHFNFSVEDHNYHILRTGCFPFVKYHCTKREEADLFLEDRLFTALKIVNLGLPCLAYGIAAKFLIRHREVVRTDSGPVTLHFLLKEDT